MSRIALLPLLAKTAVCAGAASYGLPPFIVGTLRAICENLLGALTGQVLSEIGSLRHRTSADAPGEALQLALARAMAAACDDIGIEKWIRDRTRSLLDLKPPYHAHVEDFLRELRRNPEDIVGSGPDDGMLRAFLDSPSLANFSPLAAAFGDESLPGLDPAIRTELVEALFLRVRIRFWDEVKSDDVAWRAYSAEIFKEIRGKVESLGAGQEKILAALRLREEEIRELPAIPAGVCKEITSSRRDLQADFDRVNGKLDRLLASGVRIEAATRKTYWILRWMASGAAILILAGVAVYWSEDKREREIQQVLRQQEEEEARREARRAEQTDRHLKEIYDFLQSKPGVGSGLKEPSPAERIGEYERFVAEREEISVEEVRRRIKAGTRSKDALISSQAHLLAGQPELALEKAALVQEEEADAFERIAEARWVEARSLYNMGQFEKSLKKYRELLAMLDESSEILASIHRETGTVLVEMGRSHEAIAEYRRTVEIQKAGLPPQSVPLAETRVWLGEALLAVGDLEAAENTLRDALPTIRAMYSTADSMADMNLRLLGICLVLRGKPGEAVEIFRENLELVKSDKANRRDVEEFVSAELAWALQLAGRENEASSYLARAIQIEKESGEGADVDFSYFDYYFYYDAPYSHPASGAMDWLSQWADFLRDGSYYKEEEALRRNLIRIAGPRSERDRYFMADLETKIGFSLQNQFKVEEAEGWFRKALGRFENALEPFQWNLAMARDDLGSLLRELGKSEEAEILLRQAVTFFDHNAGYDADLAASLNNLALVLSDLGAWEEAESLFRRALKIQEDIWGADSSRVLMTMGNLSSALIETGKPDLAKEVCDRGLTIHRARPDEEPYAVSGLYFYRGCSLMGLDELEAAERDLRTCLEMDRKIFGERHYRMARTFLQLGRCLFDRGDLAGAEGAYREAIGIASSGPDRSKALMVICHNGLGLVHHEQSKPEEAEQAYRQAIAMGEKIWGTNGKFYSDSLFNLSLVLTNFGKLEEAERFLQRALAATSDLPPDRMQRAFELNCVARLREAQGRHPEAESSSRGHLKIFFLHRKRTGRAHPHEDEAIAIHSFLMKNRGRSKEETEAEILKLRQEAGI